MEVGITKKSRKDFRNEVKANIFVNKYLEDGRRLPLSLF